MSKRWIKAGLTDQTIDIFVLDSSSTTGAGLTGLTHSTSGLTCYYRKGATGTSTQLTLATQTVGGAHSDGGFVAIDGTNMPGLYRLDLSDTMVAAEGMLTIYLRGATNMAPVVAELEIVDVDIYDSVRLGLTALPNVASGSAGALITSGTGTAQLSVSSGAVTVGTINNNAITAASIAADASEEIADAVLSRNVSNVENAIATASNFHNLATVVLANLENSISGTTLTIKKTGGSTLTTKTLTTTAASSADVITGVD